jgi:hypothetical protein
VPFLPSVERVTQRIACVFGKHYWWDCVHDVWEKEWPEDVYEGSQAYRHCHKCGKIELGEVVKVTDACNAWNLHENAGPWNDDYIKMEIRRHMGPRR